MEDNSLALLEEKFPFLTPKELSAYVAYNNLGQSPLAPSKSDSLYELFLKGRTCEEIVRVNRGISLAQVVHSRIHYGWDEKRQRYLDDLFTQASNRVKVAQVEMAGLISDLLGVARDVMVDKINNYLQTKDPSYLADLPVHNLGQIKALTQLLTELTSPSKQGGTAPVTININNEPTSIKKSIETVTVEANASPFRMVQARLKNGEK